MSNLIAWIAAEADPKAASKISAPTIAAENIVSAKIVTAKIGSPEIVVAEIVVAEMVNPNTAARAVLPVARSSAEAVKTKPSTRGLVAHTFPAQTPITAAQPPPFAKDAKDGPPTLAQFPLSEYPDSGISAPPVTFSDNPPRESECEVLDRDREQRIYRGRTVGMLRRYMRYSIETGRLPSLLGGEMFRAKVTTYTVVTFEDRVIFVHDMEKCLDRLDGFSRQLIARNILQEHDQAATGRILQCTERTVRTLVPLALDVLGEILLEVGLLERLESTATNSCQGGKTGPFDASHCEDGKYKS